MKVTPGTAGILWIQVHYTGHCMWETDGVMCSMLMILSFLLASLKPATVLRKCQYGRVDFIFMYAVICSNSE